MHKATPVCMLRNNRFYIQISVEVTVKDTSQPDHVHDTADPCQNHEQH